MERLSNSCLCIKRIPWDFYRSKMYIFCYFCYIEKSHRLCLLLTEMRWFKHWNICFHFYLLYDDITIHPHWSQSLVESSLFFPAGGRETTASLSWSCIFTAVIVAKQQQWGLRLWNVCVWEELSGFWLKENSFFTLFCWSCQKHSKNELEEISQSTSCQVKVCQKFLSYFS